MYESITDDRHAPLKVRTTALRSLTERFLKNNLTNTDHRRKIRANDPRPKHLPTRKLLQRNPRTPPQLPTSTPFGRNPSAVLRLESASQVNSYETTEIKVNTVKAPTTRPEIFLILVLASSLRFSLNIHRNLLTEVSGAFFFSFFGIYGSVTDKKNYL